jgi:peptidoglycan/LPS O-acetylase OafA/YrhL
LAAGEPGGDTRFRTDLQGLRAIAVILIVLYHAGVTGLSGGYIGVDVFFVLSGYLITGLLVRELGSSGRVAVSSFYARRARRILPASFLVLGVTLAASAVILSPIHFASTSKDVAAAAVYVPNIRFALEQTDYWHPTAISPVLHFWSLGVEEQFYLIWPTFLLIAWRFSGRSSRGLAFWVCAATVASLILGILLTPARPTAAFYLLPTRAWELGVGAILVFADGRFRTMPASVSTVAAWTGLFMIGASAVLFDSATAFPGVAALLPVLGTALLVAAGASQRQAWPQPLLASRPMQFFGQISYSLYLWHWPLIVLGAVVAAAVTPAVRVPIEVGLAVLLAALTYRWVEDPLRTGRFIGTVPRRNLSIAVVGSLCLVVVAVSTGVAATQRFEPERVAVATSSADPLAGLLPTSGPTVDDPLPSPDEEVLSATSPPTAASPPPTADGPLPDDLMPSLLKPLSAGPAKPPPPHCGLSDPDTISPPCVSGDPGSPTTVVLFGDSHVTQWYPAVYRIAAQRHWRLITLVKASCGYQDTPLEATTRNCEAWRANSFARIADERPALVILAGNHLLEPAGADGDPAKAQELMLDGVSRTIARLRSMGARVAVLGDTPHLTFEPVDCLSRNPDHTIECAVDRAVLFDEPWLEGEAARAIGGGAIFVDTASWLCPSEPCPMVIGRYLVYRDTNHLGMPFVWALTSRLDAALNP